MECHSSTDPLGEQDLIAQWLLDLHLVRHPVGSSIRSSSRLQLLATRFGQRTVEGYCLPFLLTHSRIAELIGVTRSTVTRLFSRLKAQGKLVINEPEGVLVLSPTLMCGEWPMP